MRAIGVGGGGALNSLPQSPSPFRTPSQHRRAAAQTCCCHTYTVRESVNTGEDSKLKYDHTKYLFNTHSWGKEKGKKVQLLCVNKDQIHKSSMHVKRKSWKQFFPCTPKTTIAILQTWKIFIPYTVYAFWFQSGQLANSIKMHPLTRLELCTDKHR